MKFFYSLFILYFGLIFFFPIRSYHKIKNIYYFDKPIWYSRFSFFTKEVNLEHCFDKNLETSCYEFYSQNLIKAQPKELKISPEETAFVLELSPTHHMGFYPPKINPLLEFWVYLSKEDLKYNIPKEILLIFYEQKLYQINRDYRFPDQPIKKREILISIKNQEGWQKFKLPQEEILESKGLFENIYQRWVKIIIKEIYKNNITNRISISELFFKDQFYYENF